MPQIFKNLNVLEILRLGLAGLCFLLAFLAFGLINNEQQYLGPPREGILYAIYFFLGVNLLTAILVAVAGYFGPRPQSNPDSDELVAETYLVDYTSFLVDLTQWTEMPLGSVVVTRTDYVRKVSDTKEDYVIPYFTTGESIDCKPITFSSRPRFVGPKNDPDRKGVHYDYVLPIGHQPVGHSERVSSQFTFPSGFTNPEKEWWQARIAYPSKTISVVFLFPTNKPAKNMSVSRRRGDEAPQPIDDNLANPSDEGRVVTWVGINQKENSRIQFDWDW
jgi:hypothetical protein